MKDDGTKLLVDGGSTNYALKYLFQKYKFVSNPCFFQRQGFFVASNNFTQKKNVVNFEKLVFHFFSI